jgi:8-oxo-dGTP diphosphatase
MPLIVQPAEMPCYVGALPDCCRMRFAMQDQIARTVGALLIRSDGKVLLGLRSPTKKAWPGHWDSIGGRVEKGESLEQALVREVQEEIGVTPVEFELIATVRERRPQDFGDALHHIYAIAKWQGGEPANVCDEHTELEWFGVNEMLMLTNIVDADYPVYVRQVLATRFLAAKSLATRSS